jgi:hypothetical protein
MPFRLYKLIFYSANLSFNLFRRTCINLQSLIDFSSLETKLVKNVSLCKWKLERNLLFWYDCPVIRKGLFQRLCVFATKAHKRSLLKELFLFFSNFYQEIVISQREAKINFLNLIFGASADLLIFVSLETNL